MHLLQLFLALSLLAPSSPSLQKCEDSAFCTRMRNATSDAFVIEPNLVKVAGAVVTAAVRNTADANGTFSLALTAYTDGTVRLFIDETPGKAPRWQVPDVLVPGLEARQQVSDRELGTSAACMCPLVLAALGAACTRPTHPPALLSHPPCRSGRWSRRPAPS